MARRKPQAEDHPWILIPHICRACFGRMLMRETIDRRRVYRCSNCGIEREGPDERVICCCGLKLRGRIDAGLRCQPNENKSPEFPSEIVALQQQPRDKK